MARILFYERYDGFGVLYYPHDPFDLAVVWTGKQILARPIIELPNGESYFLYQSKKVNPFIFALRPDEPAPDWTDVWLQGVQELGLIIDLKNLTEEHADAFKAMLDRKHSRLQKWLLAE
jgi:hypothetical protein